MTPTTRELLKFGSFAVGGFAALTLIAIHASIWIAVGVYILMIAGVLSSFMESNAIPGLVILALVWAIGLWLGV